MVSIPIFFSFIPSMGYVFMFGDMNLFYTDYGGFIDIRHVYVQ